MKRHTTYFHIDLEPAVGQTNGCFTGHIQGAEDPEAFYLEAVPPEDIPTQTEPDLKRDAALWSIYFQGVLVGHVGRLEEITTDKIDRLLSEVYRVSRGTFEAVERQLYSVIMVVDKPALASSVPIGTYFDLDDAAAACREHARKQPGYVRILDHEFDREGAGGYDIAVQNKKAIVTYAANPVKPR